jgi:ribosomal protein S27AE
MKFRDYVNEGKKVTCANCGTVYEKGKYRVRGGGPQLNNDSCPKCGDTVTEATKKKLPVGINKLLREILKDRKAGKVMSHSQSMKVQSAWMQYYGQPGVSHYPYTDENEMLKDLLKVAGL